MTPPSERVVKADSTPRDPDIERLLHGRLHEPRRVLGLHCASARTTPSCACCCRTRCGCGSSSPPSSSSAFPGRRCSSGEGRAASIAAPYRIRWESHDGRWHEGYDPYSFPLEIDEHDLARFAGGSHIHAHRFLGAHERTIAGVRGIRFAVWAPNAERVSVVGTFNHWDGRYHPMSVRGSSGVWELFVPELGAGELYKYELYTRDSRELKLKSRPVRRGVRAAARDGGDHDAAVDVPLGRRGVARAARAARLAQGADLDLRGASWARGGATPPAISWAIARSPGSSPPTSRTSASRTSSCCRSRSIRSTTRGATSARATSRRRAGTARPTSCASSSPSCTGTASACSSTGCRGTSRRTTMRSRASTARRSTSTAIRRRASTPTGTRSCSTTRATRSRASCCRARSAGSRTSTSTGCASTPSPRCCISTIRASRTSGRRISTAATRTSRRSRS